jgi:hypothetical protein
MSITIFVLPVWFKNLEVNQSTILVLLDFSKAFDIVCTGFHSTVAALVSFCLSPRHENPSVVNGIPRDSSFSPLCFFLFIDDITDIMES